MCTFDPILHPPPTTEFKMLVLLPILVPDPITENGPTTADCDCEISERGEKNLSSTLNKWKQNLSN